MGKLTDALRKAAEERLQRIEKLDVQAETKYEFIAKKTVDSKIDPRIVSFYDSKSPVSEQYKILRTNIQAINSKTPLKAIAITSAIHGEGKTITAINLAISMANDLNKKSVLLVDADLRRSRISKYLGVPSGEGLSDLVLNGTDVNEVLINIGIDNLTVLPAGKTPANPAEILGSAKMGNLIAALKAKYDYIILDTPPIVPVTDAGLLGAQADGVVMVIQANRTQRGVVQHAKNLLTQAHAKVLGYTLTGIQYHIPEYIYRYL